MTDSERKEIELRDLTVRFSTIIGGTDYPSRIKNRLFSEDRNIVFDEYLDAVGGDLETDYLQKIYQYYNADRDTLAQDFTPKSIASLCSQITLTKGNVVCDICSGSGALTIQKWVHDSDKTFICEELDENVIPFLLFNLAIRNIEGYVIRRDILTLETFEIYRLQKGDKYSIIEQVDDYPKFIASEIVSNPPYNLKWNPPTGMFADNRFLGKVTPTKSNANYAFVMTAIEKLEENGRAAFVLPSGCLTSSQEQDCRQWLVEQGLIERIIALPERMFESTSIPTCVIVLSYGNEDVMFFDVTGKAEKEERKQRGQFGGASHEKRTYVKTVNVLPDDVIDNLCSCDYDLEGFSKAVDRETLKQNEYNLMPRRYVDSEYEPQTHRPFKDIISDINRIAKEKSMVKITCNETYAKQNGLYELSLLQDQAEEIDLQRTFDLFGETYVGRRYLTLTKSKVFKIESQDKDQWSMLFNMFVPMLRQHIYYLNMEENRLLAELRDALLPELMNPDSEIAKKIQGDD